MTTFSGAVRMGIAEGAVSNPPRWAPGSAEPPLAHSPLLYRGALTNSDAEVHDILHGHRDSGAISRLYATGEITEHTATAVGVAADHLDLDAQHLEAVRLLHVLDYVREVGERPQGAN
ncbi:hypothetical protein [Streptomyces californicus]|uniref:hypothetical protein n=1 Tax=Streptomyces californicus TaxID=67351 RepID=UPI0037900006